ncbi:very-long-chain (3R)-3-hydroxyacyl-CoA dehydratase PASTICCINO 2A-like isoform X4 [Miscanthus floridulus]|uniref:very-long-chain (3R)-3-hydroxyacyl-CoA dehydratase PASTICCINO 2A-like isoform X4 n=1 Tax=Miscanthus floridulus TaxID=154761 RepID=UPI00345AF707
MLPAVQRKFAGHNMLGFFAWVPRWWLVKATTLKPRPQCLPPCNSSMAGDDGSVVRWLYLSLYNWVTFFGWLQVLYHAILALLGGGHEAVYAAVKLPLLFSQTAAIAEIPHSIIGLVRSPISATLPQVCGRILVTWYIVWSFPETQSHVLVTSLVLSWSITEVIRYSFFGLKEAFGITPFWLLWLRYSTFTVLYPIGLISEVGLIFTAMPHMKGRSFYICAGLTSLYIPGFPYLYRYMLAQRKKVLSKAKTA